MSATETLTLNGVLLHRPGFCRVDKLRRLWAGPPKRVHNGPVPLLDGSVGYPMRDDEDTRVLPIVIEGRCDVDGTPHEDLEVGLWANVRYIRENIGDVNTLVDCEVQTPDEAVVLEGEVQIVGLDLEPGARHVMTGDLELTVPAGSLTIVEGS